MKKISLLILTVILLKNVYTPVLAKNEMLSVEECFFENDIFENKTLGEMQLVFRKNYYLFIKKASFNNETRF